MVKVGRYLLNTENKLTKNDKKKFKYPLIYFVDKLDINLSMVIFKSRGKSKNEYIQLCIGDYKINCKLEWLDEGRLLINCYTSFNLNVRARNYIKSVSECSRTGSLVSEGTNYIPINYRRFLKKESILLKHVRRTTIRHTYEDIEELKRNLKNHFSEKLNFNLTNVSMISSFRHIEINIDVETPLGNSLLESPQLLDVLNRNQNIYKAKLNQYKDDNSNKKLVIKSIEQGFDQLRGSIRGFTIEGYEFEFYIKEVSKHNNLERFELRFKNKGQILNALKRVSFSSLEEFKGALNNLGNYWRTNLKNIFLQMDEPTDVQQLNKILESFCWLDFKSHGRTVFLLLTTPPYIIETNSKKARLVQGCCRKVRQVGKERKYLKIRKRSVYETDYEWLERYSNDSYS